MKLDLKSIIMLVLLILGIGLLTNQLINTNNHKKEIKMLEEKNNEIEKQKKLIDLDIQRLKDEFKLKESKMKDLQDSSKILKEKLRLKDLEIKKANDDLNKFKGELSKTRKRIEELEKNPNYKNGDGLLNSLREKTK